MRIAYIIYYEEEAKKNSGFIEMLKAQAVKYDIEMNFQAFEKINEMSENVFRDKFKDAIFVINRTRNYKLSERFEKLKIKVFHSSKIMS